MQSFYDAFLIAMWYIFAHMFEMRPQCGWQAYQQIMARGQEMIDRFLSPLREIQPLARPRLVDAALRISFREETIA